MNIGFDYDRCQLVARVEKANAVVVDVETATDLAVDVQEGHHLNLASTTDKNVTVSGECGCSPRGCLVAIKERVVGEAGQPLHSLDANHSVGIDGDDCTHLLQNADQVDDLGLDGSARELSLAICHTSRKQDLLGCSNRRVRK